MYRRRGGLNARAAHKVQAPQGGQGGQGGGMPAPPGAQHQPQDGSLQSQQVRSYIVVLLVTFTHFLKSACFFYT